MRTSRLIALFVLFFAGGAHADADELDARQIVERAHAAAGGEFWVRPRTLRLEGHADFYREGHRPVRHERHAMWRVYSTSKSTAHAASGRVRIDSYRGGEPAMIIAYDGRHTYSVTPGTEPGQPRVYRTAEPADSRRWQSNFGFGVIRHALDDGYLLERLADDQVDGRPAHIVRVTDPGGGETLFGIAIDDYAILMVAFDTPRGWHERRYSDFFSRPGVSWVQPGRVRLFYRGIKQNEVIWTSFAVNEPIGIEWFRPDSGER